MAQEKKSLKRQFFIAVFPPDEIKRQINDNLVHKEDATKGWEWKRAEEYHMSLAFPGAITEEELQILIKALDKVYFEAFSMSIDGVGHFLRKENKNNNNTHVVWARPDNQADNAIRELHYKIVGIMEEYGFKYGNREISPHMTIVKPPVTAHDLMKDFAAAASGFKSEAWQCDRFVLCETLDKSDPDHPHNNNGQGSRYKVIAEFKAG